MNRAASVIAATLVALASAASLGGCREEPTIVIKFEPNDLGGAKPAGGDLGRRAASDAGARPADLGLGLAKKALPAGGKQASECKLATDCVVEPLDCCDCANGGKQHAIAKKQAAAAKATREARCKHAVCTMMLSTDPSCGARAECVDGACVLGKKKD